MTPSKTDSSFSDNNAAVRHHLTCADCEAEVTETWDDRCCACFYVYTGGDQGEDDWWQKHTVIRDGTVYAEVKR